MEKTAKIYIAGHTGLVGSAILRRLNADGYENIVVRKRSELDLTDQAKVKDFFEAEKPAYVFFAAAKVGGVFANNTYRAEFIYENILMESNVIHQSFLSGVKKLIFYSNADMYPKSCPQPAREEYLLTGPLEPTCEPFAIAKIAGVKMCESYNRQYGTEFLVIVAPNIYGPNERYDIMNSQVLPSLIRSFHEAKKNGQNGVSLWGTGAPVRDFIYADDVVDASLYLINRKTEEYIYNIGTGKGFTIKELAGVIKDIVGFKGDVVFDAKKPDGTAKKLLDITRINKLGWKYSVELPQGVKKTYDSFLEQVSKGQIRVSNVSRVKTCPQDKNVIDERSRKKTILANQPDTYDKKVVLKPWGYEFLVFENECAAVWFLHINKGHSTSMHCHQHKKTSLVLLSEKAMNNTLENRRYLKAGDALILQKGVFHSTKSLSEEGVSLLEIESPPIKTDLVRLEDKYGREYFGYEGLEEMETKNLEEFNHFDFQETKQRITCQQETDNYLVKFDVFRNNEEFKKDFKIRSGGVYVSLKGEVFNKNGDVVLSAGDAQKLDNFIDIPLEVKDKLVLLEVIIKN